MKKTRLVFKSISFLFFTFLLILFVNANANSFIQKSIPEGYEQIRLHGQLELGHGPNDVEAYTDQVNIYVVFHRSFGVVNITLFNELGVSVYSDVVDTTIQQTVIIPISGKPSGTYSVLLESDLGYSEGDFSKTN